MSAGTTIALSRRVRQIAETIVDTATEEGKTLVRAADELERLGWLEQRVTDLQAALKGKSIVDAELVRKVL